MSTTVRRIQMLEEEIDVLRAKIRPEDTGHIYTAINVLQERIKELQNEELEYQRTRNKTYAEIND